MLTNEQVTLNRVVAEACSVHAETGCTPRELVAQRTELLAALERIERWFGEFPAVTGRDGNPSRYGVEYGSNGERDYMRGVARDAIAKVTGERT